METFDRASKKLNLNHSTMNDFGISINWRRFFENVAKDGISVKCKGEVVFRSDLIGKKKLIVLSSIKKKIEDQLMTKIRFNVEG